MTPPESMAEYAVIKTSSLLEDVVAALQAAADKPEMETVHKMRVAIRRFQQGLRLFRVYVRKNGADQIKKELHDIMQAAGELRNYDIAIELVKKKHDGSHDLTESLSRQRSKAQQKLIDRLRTYANGDLSSEWLSKLGLDRT